MSYFLFLFLLVAPSYSQHQEQPQKESLEDLRSVTVLFMISDLKAEKIYSLERTAELDHFLRMKMGGKDSGVIRKTDSREAKKMDQEFAARFLKIQYEYPSSTDKCKAIWHLNMKGEELEICNKDDGKSQEIDTFIDELKKRF